MPTLKEILAAKQQQSAPTESKVVEDELFVLASNDNSVGASSVESLMILMSKTDAHPSTQKVLFDWLYPYYLPQNTHIKFVRNFCPFLCVELAARLKAPVSDVYGVWVGLIKKGYSDG